MLSLRESGYSKMLLTWLVDFLTLFDMTLDDTHVAKSAGMLRAA